MIHAHRIMLNVWRWVCTELVFRVSPVYQSLHERRVKLAPLTSLATEKSMERHSWDIRNSCVRLKTILRQKLPGWAQLVIGDRRYGAEDHDSANHYV